MKTEKTQGGLLISPIRNGTVIDHITAGEALNVLKIIGITGSTDGVRFQWRPMWRVRRWGGKMS